MCPVGEGATRVRAGWMVKDNSPFDFIAANHANGKEKFAAVFSGSSVFTEKSFLTRRVTTATKEDLVKSGRFHPLCAFVPLCV